MKHKGFTVVELLVVIVVIGLLAAITILSYNFLRDDAMDSKIKSVVKTTGDAILLQESREPSRINGIGYFRNGGGVDTLVPQYLKDGYRRDITSKNASHTDYILRYYHCPGIKDEFVIYAALNNPTSSDISNFNTIRNSCGHGETVAPTTGANKYNYAQKF